MVLVECVPARPGKGRREPGQTLLQRERIGGVAVRAGHVEADVGVGPGDPAAVSGRELQRADEHVRALHGRAEGLCGEARQRAAEGGVVAALRAADVGRNLGAGLLAHRQVLGAAVLCVGEEEPAGTPVHLQPGLPNQLRPQHAAVVDVVPVRIDMVNKPLQLRGGEPAVKTRERTVQWCCSRR